MEGLVIKKIESGNSLKCSSLGMLGGHLTWGIAAGSLLLALFAKLAEDVMYQEIGLFDAAVASFIRSQTSEGLTQLAVIITNTGSAAFVIGLMLVLAAYMYFRLKQVWEPLLLSACLAGAWILNNVLKELFHRTRPDIQHLVAADGFSFPSGHAMIATAFYGMLGYIIWSDLRQRSKPAWYVMLLTFTLVAAIGASRVYLGVHFPSDVIAGFAAGGVWLLACVLALGAARRRGSGPV
jgi:undecaprenyl-diphosphatase